MLKICLVFWKSEPQYAYKRYAYKEEHVHTFKVFLFITLASFGNLCIRSTHFGIDCVFSGKIYIFRTF